MVVTGDRTNWSPLHPLHAILLAFLFPLLVGALFSDLAYSSSYQIQWANFASWLIAGALFVGSFVFLWALVDWLRHRGARNGRRGLYTLLLLATLLLGFVNAMVHAKDAYATMPAWINPVGDNCGPGAAGIVDRLFRLFPRS